MKIIKETGGFMSDNTKQNNRLNGVYATMNDIIGYENVEKLYIHFKGTQVNFPTKLFQRNMWLRKRKETMTALMNLLIGSLSSIRIPKGR